VLPAGIIKRLEAKKEGLPMYEAFLGQIQLFTFGFAPEGWMICRGAVLNIRQNAGLYSLLGNRFGGDGRETFSLPNLMNARPIKKGEHMCYYIATQGVYPPRD